MLDELERISMLYGFGAYHAPSEVSDFQLSLQACLVSMYAACIIRGLTDKEILRLDISMYDVFLVKVQ